MLGSHLLEMTWRDALFCHWPVAPETVAERLPEGLEVATYDGDAYLGIVPFVMEDIRPRGVPFGLSFPELNLRTYVDGPRGTGVYFFNLDADDPVGVPIARRLFQLPYYNASMQVRRKDDRVRFTSHRTHRGAAPCHFDATYEPTGEAFEADPSSLTAFLLENYRFYAAGNDLYCGEIDHEPWPIRRATVDLRTNTLFETNDFEQPDGEPIVHYSPGTDVTASRIHRA